MKEINEAKDLKGKSIVIAEFEKVFPPEYYKPHRGRRPSVTKYSLNKDKVQSIQIAIVDTVTTGRAFVDMDSQQMMTRLYYHFKDGTTGVSKFEPNPIFIEVIDGVYIHKSLEPVIDQIRNLLNG